MITEKVKQKLARKNEKALEGLLIKACSENDLELAQYILFSEELKIHPKIECRNYQVIRDAANKGAYEVIEFLLNSEKINKKEEFIKARKQVLIRNACHSGNLKLVKYLLETPGIKEYVKISFDKYKSFEEAIYSKNKDLVFYLYDTYKSDINKLKPSYLDIFFRRIYKEGFLNFAKDLIAHSDIEYYFIVSDKYEVVTEFINQNNKEGVEFLFNYPNSLVNKRVIDSTDYGSVMVAMSKANLNILEFIIIEQNIPFTNTIKEFLNNKNYNTENMRKMFENRELYKKLETNLISDNKLKIKNKKI